MNKTFNPFQLFGSWIGLLAGVFATQKEINPFSFLDKFFDIIEGFNAETNIVVGFFVGYILHLFIRSIINNNKKKFKE